MIKKFKDKFKIRINKFCIRLKTFSLRAVVEQATNIEYKIVSTY